MFDIAPTELLLVALVALVVIGPKDLPRVMRMVGQWTGKARAMAKHFRAGLDEMVRQSELDEMEKKWAAENERIMHEHSTAPPPIDDEPPAVMLPLPPAGPAQAVAAGEAGIASEQPADLKDASPS